METKNRTKILLCIVDRAWEFVFIWAPKWYFVYKSFYLVCFNFFRYIKKVKNKSNFTGMLHEMVLCSQIIRISCGLVFVAVRWLSSWDWLPVHALAQRFYALLSLWLVIRWPPRPLRPQQDHNTLSLYEVRKKWIFQLWLLRKRRKKLESKLWHRRSAAVRRAVACARSKLWIEVC